MLKSCTFVHCSISRYFPWKTLQVAIDPGDSWKIFTKALRRMARSAGTKGAMEITAATKRPEKKKAVKSVMTNLAIL